MPAGRRSWCRQWEDPWLRLRPAISPSSSSLLAGESQAGGFLEEPPQAAALAAGASPLVAGERLGPYEIDVLIGAGGMGQVYKAHDTRLDRAVAIKVLPTAFASDPQRRGRFEREAKALSGLSHPNICALYDVGDYHPPASPTGHGPAGAGPAALYLGPLTLTQGRDRSRGRIGGNAPDWRGATVRPGIPGAASYSSSVPGPGTERPG